MSSDNEQDTTPAPKPRRDDNGGSSDGSTSTAGGRQPGLPKEIFSEISKEIGGRDGPDPVRYGDWEKKGRCIDF